MKGNEVLVMGGVVKIRIRKFFRRVGIAHHSLRCPSTTRPPRLVEVQGPGRRTASIASVKSSINSLLTDGSYNILKKLERIPNWF